MLNFVRHAGSESHLTPIALNLSSSQFVLLVSISGTVLINSSSSARSLIAPSSLAIVNGNLRHTLTLGRGNYDILLFTFSLEDIQILVPLLDNIKDIRAFHINEMAFPVDQVIQAFRTVAEVVPPDSPTLTAHALSVIASAIAIQEPNCRPDVLADIPTSAQDSLLDLLKQVKKSSHQQWSLKEAAEYAAYSAFHLSRSFRATTSFGFPEFVDRCRSENAAELILETNLSFEEISQKCGFGSSHSFRNACREYYGFLPSELR